MLSLFLLTLLLILTSAVVGAIAGLLAVRWFLTHDAHSGLFASAEPSDPFISAEIDQAASAWAQTNGRPEAAGIMADKLHMLYALARRRRQP